MRPALGRARASIARGAALLAAPLLASLIAATPATAQVALPPDAKALTPKRYKPILDHVLPKADEQRWAEIPWHPSLASAREEARATSRPILLWAMNGHPLGCT